MLNTFPPANDSLEFVILVTSYNNEKWVDRNLDSIVQQRSTNKYHIICLDDGSTDRTGKLMDEYVEKYQLRSSFLHIIHNKVRVGSALENIYNIIHSEIADHKIVVFVDGDDALSFNGALERLEKEYRNPDVWMTYGRFVVWPTGEFWTNCGGYPDEVIRARSFRKHPNVLSHLKTFRAALFKRIRKEDLLCPDDGGFYKIAWDMAMNFPMLEMCAPKDSRAKNHSVFIADTILYLYNHDNPLSDSGTAEKRAEQIRLDRYIRSLPQYEPIERL